jgi:hypothetical protein
MQKLVWMLLALVLCSATVLSGQLAAGAAQTAKPLTEADELRQQNELMWKYDQRMLQTVNYAMFAIIFIATASSVISFVNANRELASLRRDIEAGLQNAVERVSMNAAKQQTDIENRVEEHFRRSGESSEKLVEQLSMRFDALRGTLEESLEQAKKLSAESLKKAAARQKFDLARLACDVHSDRSGPLSNLHLLRAQIDLLEAKVEMDGSGSNGSYIQEMAKTLERPGLSGLNDAEYERVLNLLDVVTTANPGDASRLLTALIAARNSG